jgi:hypothetical protein
LPVDWETRIVLTRNEDGSFLAEKKSSGFLRKKPKVYEELKTIIIHMHGGGFVAMSSASH